VFDIDGSVVLGSSAVPLWRRLVPMSSGGCLLRWPDWLKRLVSP
jgi:hypothetical protein